MLGLCVRLFVSVQNGRPYMRTGLQGKPCLEQDLAGWAMDLLRYYVGQVSWKFMTQEEMDLDFLHNGL